MSPCRKPVIFGRGKGYSQLQQPRYHLLWQQASSFGPGMSCCQYPLPSAPPPLAVPALSTRKSAGPRSAEVPSPCPLRSSHLRTRRGPARASAALRPVQALPVQCFRKQRCTPSRKPPDPLSQASSFEQARPFLPIPTVRPRRKS